MMTMTIKLARVVIYHSGFLALRDPVTNKKHYIATARVPMAKKLGWVVT